MVLFHDHGSRYVGKMFNDDWMRDRGFLEVSIKTAADLVANQPQPLVTDKNRRACIIAMDRMKVHNISQLPVEDSNGFVGAVNETCLFRAFVADKNEADKPVKDIMMEAFPIVERETPIDKLSKLITRDNDAVLVHLGQEKYHIITKSDIILAM